jgi:hypothetical protein
MHNNNNHKIKNKEKTNTTLGKISKKVNKRIPHCLKNSRKKKN